jgi:antitoxin HicB
MQKYWAVVEGEGDNYGAFVPDVSGAVGAGDTLEQAVASLAESLATQLEDLRERGLELPAPTPKDQLDLSEFKPEEPYQVVEVTPAPMNPVSLAIERALERSGTNKAELARRMGIPRSNATRITDPFYWGHSSDTLRKVAQALHAEMRVTFEPREEVAA